MRLYLIILPIVPLAAGPSTAAAQPTSAAAAANDPLTELDGRTASVRATWRF